MTIIIGLDDETDLEIAEIDSAIESDLQTGEDIGAESGTIVTGEMTPMIGIEDAPGILLTRGPVAEVMIIGGKLHPEPKPCKRPRSVYLFYVVKDQRLNF
jgi:hypothetical protein